MARGTTSSRALPSLGIAIHHARLPSPFLREVESLLASGVLQVVIASPTLAQGLNLNAAVLLIPNLYRAGELLTGEEFANVAGRAGRAFVDLDGLVLHVMFKPEQWRMKVWSNLVNSAKARSLASGIIGVVNEVMRRLARTDVFAREDAMEYLANSQDAWFPANQASDTETIASLIERLDATVLGLIDALDANSEDLPALLDEALAGSLWARQISRLKPETRGHQLWIMQARARLIWNKSSAEQRRAQFAMGVGLESGLALDAIAAELTQHLDAADLAAIEGNADGLATALAAMGKRLFQIPPFVPETTLSDNWVDVLASWIAGADVGDIGLDNMRMVEEAFIYRLVWGAEAIRMRRRAAGGESEYVEGSATACLDAGLPRSNMAMLVRAGLPSRVAAQEAVNQTQPTFGSLSEMNEWLSSNEITALSSDPSFPTAETAEIWKRFRTEALATPIQRWNEQEWTLKTSWPSWAGTFPGRIHIDAQTKRVSVTTPDYREITGIIQTLSDPSPSLMHVTYSAKDESASISRMGRERASWQSSAASN
jgi:hypothetical protein